MSRRAAGHPLPEFTAWLIAQGRKDRTARLYEAKVRLAILAAGGDAYNTVGLRTHAMSLKSSSLVLLQSAWKLYQRFVVEQGKGRPPGIVMGGLGPGVKVMFREWLIGRRHLVAVTATTHAIAVEKVMAATQAAGHSKEALQAWYDTASRAARRHLMASWPDFQKFMVEQGGEPLPDLEFGEPEVPREVAEAIADLARVTRQRRLPLFRWKHVVEDASGAVRLLDPSTGEVLASGCAGDRLANALRVLRMWGRPADETAPVVPVAPGGRAARRLQVLRADIATLRQRPGRPGPPAPSPGADADDDPIGPIATLREMLPNELEFYAGPPPAESGDDGVVEGSTPSQDAQDLHEQALAAPVTEPPGHPRRLRVTRGSGGHPVAGPRDGGPPAAPSPGLPRGAPLGAGPTRGPRLDYTAVLTSRTGRNR